jgi:hypothetical protein
VVRKGCRNCEDNRNDRTRSGGGKGRALMLVAAPWCPSYRYSVVGIADKVP